MKQKYFLCITSMNSKIDFTSCFSLLYSSRESLTKMLGSLFYYSIMLNFKIFKGKKMAFFKDFFKKCLV